jgi:hypothetical protein
LELMAARFAASLRTNGAALFPYGFSASAPPAVFR